MTTPSMTAVVADDSRLSRKFLCDVMTELDVRVVGEAASGDEAIDLCRKFKPDLVLVDASMPGPSPQVLVTAIRSVSPGTRVISTQGRDRESLLTEVRDYLIEHARLRSRAN